MRPGHPEALQQPYDPARVESRWYGFWEEQGVFRPEGAATRGAARPFVIAIPPPNVTGSLTMGHLLGDSIRARDRAATGAGLGGGAAAPSSS